MLVNAGDRLLSMGPESGIPMVKEDVAIADGAKPGAVASALIVSVLAIQIGPV
jgi:hypothetical protein